MTRKTTDTTHAAAIARIRAEAGAAAEESDRASYLAKLATDAADRAAWSCAELHDIMSEYCQPYRVAATATADAATARAAESARHARWAASESARYARLVAKLGKVAKSQLPRAESEAADVAARAESWRYIAKEFSDGARAHAKSAMRAVARAVARIQGH